MNVTKEKAIERVLGYVGDLPVMPAVVRRVLELTENPDTSLSEISEVIQRDPGLTAKLLRVSNSPFYGMKQVVGTLKLALVILGGREVRNIVLAVSLVESLRDRNTERLLTHFGFWDHSVRVGALSKRLGNYFELALQGEDFVCGLLHDIGKMAMWKRLRDQYEPILRTKIRDGQDLCDAELKAFGFDHADVAAALAHQWNLPDTLGDSLWCHHAREDRPLSGAKDPELAALVRIANIAARDLGGREAPRDEEAWTILLRDRDPLDVERRCDLLSELCDELSKLTVPAV